MLCCSVVIIAFLSFHCLVMSNEIMQHYTYSDVSDFKRCIKSVLLYSAKGNCKGEVYHINCIFVVYGMLRMHYFLVLFS